MGSELEETTWNSCMAMLSELDKVFLYFLLPNYLWAHIMGNALCMMQRERSIYMEGIAGVSENKEDIEMGSVHNKAVVLVKLPVVEEPKLRGDELAGTVSPLIQSFQICWRVTTCTLVSSGLILRSWWVLWYWVPRSQHPLRLYPLVLQYRRSFCKSTIQCSRCH